MVFRDDNVVIIEIGSLITRAVVGLAESMTPPQVRVPTKVGIKRRPTNGETQEKPQSVDYLFDADLEEAITSKDPDLEVIRPIVGGVIKDWDAIEIFWYAEFRESWLTLGAGYCLLDSTANILQLRIMLCLL